MALTIDQPTFISWFFFLCTLILIFTAGSIQPFWMQLQLQTQPKFTPQDSELEKVVIEFNKSES